MTDNRTTKLLPCPFCGGEADTQERYDGIWTAFCKKCGAESGFPCSCNERTEDEAIKAWNKRTTTGDDFSRAVHDGHLWMRERTCRPLGEWESISQNQEVRHVSCSECGHEFGMEQKDTIPFERTRHVELPNYCPDCGAKVVEHEAE